MAVYTIIRIYQIPADSKQQATDRMAEALALGVEQDFHVTDIIREPGAKPGHGKPRFNEGKPVRKEQLTGK